MKIERINENSIRCTLTSFDLSVRDLNIRELAYGTDKVKKLFTEMMTRASNEVGFETEGMPIMIEAIPMSGDSIQLVITKVEDPEELDARFSRFSPGIQQTGSLKGAGPDDWLHKLTSELLEGATGFLQHVQSIQQGDKKEEGDTKDRKSGMKEIPMPEETWRAVGFDDIQIVFPAAKAASFFDGESVLYKKPGTTKYVLMIKGTKENQENFAKACNVLTEYGYSIRTTQGTSAYCEEHYEVITSSPAILKLSNVK